MRNKLIPTFLFLFSTFIIFAQSNNKQKKGFNQGTHIINPSNKADEVEVIFKIAGERNPAADRYILDIKTLRSCFKKQTIPKKFPKYDSSLSFDDNKRLAIHWMKSHKYLLTKERRIWLNKKLKA